MISPEQLSDLADRDERARRAALSRSELDDIIRQAKAGAHLAHMLARYIKEAGRTRQQVAEHLQSFLSICGLEVEP